MKCLPVSLEPSDLTGVEIDGPSAGGSRAINDSEDIQLSIWRLFVVLVFQLSIWTYCLLFWFSRNGRTYSKCWIHHTLERRAALPRCPVNGP